ncbi:response regulator [Paraburkholderia sediminicola]|uniref:response regulator n=1 Tax=Paraburkholderia sediminicola TaxID=458836 RepID=UPI0038B8B2C0
MKVLLVEDDVQLGQGLALALKDEGYSVEWVRKAADATFMVPLKSHLLVLLDLHLLDGSGLDTLKRMRSTGDSTPVLVISAYDDIETRVLALDAGADDFLLKPFELKELFARTRAVLRRKAGAAMSVIGSEELSLNLDTRELTYLGHTDRLSMREFALMMALLERPGVILSRRQLEDRLYGWGEEVESNAIDVLIHYVRKRFGSSLIQNVRGSGWTVMLPLPQRKQEV